MSLDSHKKEEKELMERIFTPGIRNLFINKKKEIK